MKRYHTKQAHANISAIIVVLTPGPMVVGKATWGGSHDGQQPNPYPTHWFPHVLYEYTTLLAILLFAMDKKKNKPGESNIWHTRQGS